MPDLKIESSDEPMEADTPETAAVTTTAFEPPINFMVNGDGAFRVCVLYGKYLHYDKSEFRFTQWLQNTFGVSPSDALGAWRFFECLDSNIQNYREWNLSDPDYDSDDYY